jgi:hypothetical protein
MGNHRSGVPIDPVILDAPTRQEAITAAQSMGMVVHTITQIASSPTKATQAEGETADESSRVVWAGEFDYKMVQAPPVIEAASKGATGQEAAAYLESVVNRYASQGWEFYRVDQIGVMRRPGCLGALLGMGEQATLYYVITFRRRRA